jgi:hypothetical protein
MEIYNGERNNPDPETGWRLDSVWSDQQTTGDYTVGQEFIAYYSAPGHPYLAELTYYVTGEVFDPEADGWTPLVAGEAPPEDAEVRYAWEERFEFFSSTETSYEGGSYQFFPTIEAANEDARRVALRDVSWTFAHPDRLKERSAA